MDSRTPIDGFVAALRQVCAECREERKILLRVRPLAVRLAANKGAWLADDMCRPDEAQGFSAYVLHEEPDHSLAVLVASWLPHRGTPPHDHGTWAVVTGLDGDERNEFWRRADDRTRSGYAELDKIGEKVFGPGDVLAMPAGTIHSVWNDTDRMTASLHVYGMHVNHTARSQFDPAARTEAPFKVKVTS
jgi:predicted metal-dependent enzyme (double-stranded beta helix superfamily)